MPECKFYFYEVTILGDDCVFFDGKFRNREDAISFLGNYIVDHRHLWITDVCCIQIVTDEDLMNVKNV